MIYFDTEHEAYQQKETIAQWGKTYLTECTNEEYQELQEGKRIWQDDEIVINPNYEDEQTAKRQANFEDNFLETSLGNYRLQPKGYANAQQSIDTVNAMVNALGGLTELIANMVIFYATPDFTKEEECTEEWLVEHQSHPQPMTKEQWTQFYIEFCSAYAQKMYKKELAND